MWMDIRERRIRLNRERENGMKMMKQERVQVSGASFQGSGISVQSTEERE